MHQAAQADKHGAKDPVGPMRAQDRGKPTIPCPPPRSAGRKKVEGVVSTPGYIGFKCPGPTGRDASGERWRTMQLT